MHYPVAGRQDLFPNDFVSMAALVVERSLTFIKKVNLDKIPHVKIYTRILQCIILIGQIVYI